MLHKVLHKVFHKVLHKVSHKVSHKVLHKVSHKVSHKVLHNPPGPITRRRLASVPASCRFPPVRRCKLTNSLTPC